MERGVLWVISAPESIPEQALGALYDRMTERLSLLSDPVVSGPRPAATGGTLAVPEDLFRRPPAGRLGRISLRRQPERALYEADRRLGLALNEEEVRWLCERFGALGRDPTDAELMMFAPSELRALPPQDIQRVLDVDGRTAEHSLFGMIRHTHTKNPGRVLSAYHDNAAVIDGGSMAWFGPDLAAGSIAMPGSRRVSS